MRLAAYWGEFKAFGQVKTEFKGVERGMAAFLHKGDVKIGAMHDGLSDR
jgi:hypothetical protein